jgi:uncharacterized RDD family membrane protein YckC
MTAYSSPAAMPGSHADTRVVGRRVAQYLVDAILLGVLGLIAWGIWLLAPTNPDGTLRGFGGFLVALVAGVVGVAIWVWYWVLRPAGHNGQTFGMQLLDLRITHASGAPASRGQLLVRALFLFVDTLFLGLVGLVTMLSSRNHQRVGDLVASTFVIRT